MTRYEQTATAAAAAAVAKQHTTYPHHSSPRPGIDTDAPPTAGGDDVDDELRDAFHVFDKDRDGFLNATDLRYNYTQRIIVAELLKVNGVVSIQAK